MKKIITGLIVIPLSALSVYAQGDFTLNSVSASDIIRASGDPGVQPAPALYSTGAGTREKNGLYSKSTGGAYEFPIKPGMKEWKALSSYAEMLKACQLPEPLLRKMSTAGLIETVLNYPLYMLTILAYDSMQQGFNALAGRFNGVAELLERKDAGAELLARYRGMDPAGFKEVPNGEGIGKYHFYFYSVELLLAQDAIRAGLTETQRLELQKELLAKYEMKKRVGGYGGGLAREVMSLNGVSLPEYFVRVSSTVVYTLKGSTVPALQMEPQDEITDVRQCNIEFIIGFPEATWEAGCTRMYNCHSYAWHNQSVSNTIWIDPPHQKEYWLDGSYIQWLGPVASGMKLDYPADNHSAIFVSGSNPF
ncbi:MAG: hypothetical protein Q8O90_08995, partial [Elusimicrobiota bacterium]|nr:hypothetical protein [Elusimicrobiota bacterium]